MYVFLYGFALRDKRERVYLNACLSARKVGEEKVDASTSNFASDSCRGDYRTRASFVVARDESSLRSPNRDASAEHRCETEQLFLKDGRRYRQKLTYFRNAE